jgi:hypothetical protein
LKAMTSALNFHLSSFTSIQCAVTPKNDALVVSADQQSAVAEIRPGAFYSGRFQPCMMFNCVFTDQNAFLQILQVRRKLIMDIYFYIVRAWQVFFSGSWSHRN